MRQPKFTRRGLLRFGFGSGAAAAVGGEGTDDAAAVSAAQLAELKDTKRQQVVQKLTDALPGLSMRLVSYDRVSSELPREFWGRISEQRLRDCIPGSGRAPGAGMFERSVWLDNKAGGVESSWEFLLPEVTKFQKVLGECIETCTRLGLPPLTGRDIPGIMQYESSYDHVVKKITGGFPFAPIKDDELLTEARIAAILTPEAHAEMLARMKLLQPTMQTFRDFCEAIPDKGQRDGDALYTQANLVWQRLVKVHFGSDIAVALRQPNAMLLLKRFARDVAWRAPGMICAIPPPASLPAGLAAPLEKTASALPAVSSGPPSLTPITFDATTLAQFSSEMQTALAGLNALAVFVDSLPDVPAVARLEEHPVTTHVAALTAQSAATEQAVGPTP